MSTAHRLEAGRSVGPMVEELSSFARFQLGGAGLLGVMPKGAFAG